MLARNLRRQPPQGNRPLKRIEAIRRDRAIQRKAVLDRALKRLLGFVESLGLDLVPFGSYAKGRVRGQSDLDLAIPGLVSEEARRQLEREAERVEVDEGVSIDLMFESEIPVYFRELRKTLSEYRSFPCRVRRGKIWKTDLTHPCSTEVNPVPKQSPEMVFEDIDQKLERISIELDEGIKTLVKIKVIKEMVDPKIEWRDEARSLALAIHNIYSGVEQVLEDIAKVADDFDPTSASSHSDLIILMATKTRHRPAILNPELRAMMDDFRKLRHVVRHGYGRPFRGEEIVEKFLLFQRNFLPQFLRSLERYKAHIQSAPNPEIGRNP